MRNHPHSLNEANHAITAREYVNRAHRDADLAWQQTTNLNKVVRIVDIAAYEILVAVGPSIWQELGSATFDTQPHGGGGMADNAVVTTVAVQDDFYVIAGTMVEGETKDFTFSAAGILTYTGPLSRHVHIVSNFDFTCASNNQIIQFKWFLNDQEQGIPVSRKAAVGGDVGAVSVHDDAEMSTGDTLQLRVRNRSGTANITVANLYLFAMGMV